jgi:hypothetical protein
MLGEGFPFSIRGREKNLDSTYTKFAVETRNHGCALYDKAALPHRDQDRATSYPWSSLPLRSAPSVQLRGAEAEHEHDFSTSAATVKSTCTSRRWFRSSGHHRRRAHAPATTASARHLPGDPVRHGRAGARPTARDAARSAGVGAARPARLHACEFQVLDAESEAGNEVGRPATRAYKAAPARGRVPAVASRQPGTPRRKLARDCSHSRKKTRVLASFAGRQSGKQ